MNGIHTIRKRLSLSQADLSRALGITQSMVSQYEIGMCNPSIGVATRLIQFAATRNVPLTLESIYAISDSPTAIESTDASDDTQPVGGTPDRKLKESRQVA